ncbi:hypothetical protein EZJ49_09875 [Bdellovibrio bacteriovorus]|uniref:hypothetical protein n=1 Tax=Bdellovibrio bacteriovorus TaxID=959 RepID=UPI0021D3A378|nr:hypothetical protein [Bdellovibrio bacteriovorus]UXR63382.1 hypothetical protein EZJ49_09875 [Bdellovibrio bacteriovorus]
MKTVSAFLLIVFFTNMAHAMGDLERGVLFFSNAYSFGTMLPDIEGRIAVKKLEYEKKKAEFKQQLEKNRQELHRQFLQTEKSRQQQFRAFLVEQQQLVQNKNTSFNLTVTLAQDLFQNVVSKENLAAEIEIRGSEDPGFAATWEALFKDAQIVTSPDQLTIEETEHLLFTALDLQSTLEAMAVNIQLQIETVDLDLQLLEQKLGTLP